jgi:hypothetical protein
LRFGGSVFGCDPCPEDYRIRVRIATSNAVKECGSFGGHVEVVSLKRGIQ